MIFIFRQLRAFTQAAIVGQSWWLCRQGWKHIWGQKILSQKLCFEIVRFSILTKPILKDVFINCVQNKIVQLPIMQLSKKTTFYVDIQWLKNIFVKN
jgi:hypothetical protein